jgi:hypothetical protein
MFHDLRARPIERATQAFILFNRKFFRELVDYNMIEKQYITTCCRNDERIVQVQLDMIASKQPGAAPYRLPNVFNPISVNSQVNIVSTNKMKDEINKEWAEKLGPWSAGRRVVGVKNDRASGVFNGLRYEIESVAGDQITIRDEKGRSFITNRKNLDEGYADTVHRYQGSKISEHGNIRQISRATANTFITAIGRFEKFDHIHLTWRDKELLWETEDPNSTPIGLNQKSVGFFYQLL